MRSILFYHGYSVDRALHELFPEVDFTRSKWSTNSMSDNIHLPDVLTIFKVLKDRFGVQ